jgi:hypothetical protein
MPVSAIASEMPLSGGRDLVRLLGAEADARELVAEHRAELVLRGDDGDVRAGVRERGEQGAAAQEARVVHHDLGLLLAVPEIVAADAVHRRRRAGDDRHVVRVRERRHDAVGREAGAAVREAGEPRRRAGADREVDVVGLATVDAHDDDGLLRGRVGAAVEGDGLGHGQALLRARRGRAAGRGWPVFRCMRSRLATTCSRSRRPAAAAWPAAMQSTIARCSPSETDGMPVWSSVARRYSDSSLTRRR